MAAVGAAAQVSVTDEDDYSMLKDLQINLNGEEEAFSLCLWVYLLIPIQAPATIIRQVPMNIEGDIPFLVLNEDKITLFPLLFLHEEAPHPDNSSSWIDLPSASAEIEFPLEKWVHVGCEVATNFMRLHVNGVLLAERPLSYSSNSDSNQDSSRRITLSGNDGSDGRLQGYVHCVQILPPSSSITDHYAKKPPLELSLDGSCVSENYEVEEGGDGVWNIIGGKASCRRNFSLDVVLLDALGHPMHQEMELVASLVYADNGAPVERSKDDAEAPLLTTYDGVEFPSTDRPIKLLHGRASFKLKISQLSSKCDNRLFRVRFNSPHAESYPFLEVYSRPIRCISRPIRCISRNRNSRTSFASWKKSAPTILQLEGPQSPGDEGSPEIQQNNGDGHLQIQPLRESKFISPPKRVKLGHDRTDENAIRASLEGKFETIEGTDNVPSDSESVHARNPAFKRAAANQSPISDLIIFKYCLGGMSERSILLKEVVTSAADQDMADCAEQVSLYTGCFHHRNQILMAKRLVQDGIDTWSLISRNNHCVLWKNAVPEIGKKFMKISHITRRGLSGQDIEFLRRIAGCHDDIAMENFDKMWYWLYPVANALSKDPLNSTWECTSPKWIEGFITKEEAEASLRGDGHKGLQKPGTFILRFPTSRSWPHPDAGSLIVTYVGADHTIHHKLLSLDDRIMDQKTLRDLLLAEQELSQLGRLINGSLTSSGTADRTPTELKAFTQKQ